MKTKLLLATITFTATVNAQINPWNNTINNASLQNSAIGGTNRIYGTTNTDETTSGCFLSGYDNVIKYNNSGTKVVSNCTHIFGGNSFAGGAGSFGMGIRVMAGTNDNSANAYASATLKSGSYAFGRDITAFGNYAFAIGTGIYSSNHSQDLTNTTDNSLVIGFSSTDASRPTFFVGEVNTGNSSTWDNYGTVGIGTNDTKGHTLAVRGDVVAEKMQVALFANWPDFVFKKDYTLTPLAELEKEIKRLGHLPNIPAAEVIEKNGYDMAEMDAKLLQKIEELTLYMIELKKENDELKAIITKSRQ